MGGGLDGGRIKEEVEEEKKKKKKKKGMVESGLMRKLNVNNEWRHARKAKGSRGIVEPT